MPYRFVDRRPRIDRLTELATAWSSKGRPPLDMAPRNHTRIAVVVDSENGRVDHRHIYPSVTPHFHVHINEDRALGRCPIEGHQSDRMSICRPNEGSDANHLRCRSSSGRIHDSAAFRRQ